MFLRMTELGFVLLTAAFAAAPALTQPPVRTPAPPDGIPELQRAGGLPEVLPVRQAEGGSLASATPPPETAPTRRLRITGKLERVPNLARRWDKYTKELDLPWYKDPAVQGVVLLLASRVPGAGRNYLAMAPQQPVCWCVGGGCTSLRVLSVQGGCGRLESAGDGKWERHLSSSQWKTLQYGEAFVALNLDMPPTAQAVELSILANRCGEGGSYLFPITSSHTDASAGSPVPSHLSFSPHGSRDFTATIELRLLTDGEGAFDVELKSVKVDDRDPESRASGEKCMREHGGAPCRYASLEPDRDGLVAGVATSDPTHCQ